jgi:hypothetical protein
MMVHNRACCGLQQGAEHGVAEVATVQQLDALSYAVHRVSVFDAPGEDFVYATTLRCRQSCLKNLKNDTFVSNADWHATLDVTNIVSVADMDVAGLSA